MKFKKKSNITMISSRTGHYKNDYGRRLYTFMWMPVVSN